MRGRGGRRGRGEWSGQVGGYGVESLFAPTGRGWTVQGAPGREWATSRGPQKAICGTAEPMLYQLGESGRSSAIRSPALTVSATEMFAAAITSLFSVVPFRERPNAIPALVISARTFSRSELQFLIIVSSTPGGQRSAESRRTPLTRSSALLTSATPPRVMRFSLLLSGSMSQANRTAASHATRDALWCENRDIAPSAPSSLPRLHM